MMDWLILHPRGTLACYQSHQVLPPLHNLKLLDEHVISTKFIYIKVGDLTFKSYFHKVPVHAFWSVIEKGVLKL